MAYVALIKIKLPFFSIRNPESFQVGSSLPIPPPSALMGSLAYALAIKNGLSPNEALAKVRNYVALARASLISEAPAIPNPILLWRYRILDKKREVLKLIKTKRYSYTDIKNALEQKYKDALYREYLFAHNISVIYVLKKDKMISKDTFYLISRLGDTESICSVTDVQILTYREIQMKSVETKYPLIFNEEFIDDIKGDYMIIKMTDESRDMKAYVIPIRRRFIETKRGVKAVIYEPSKVRINLRRYVRVYVFNDDYVVDVPT